MRKLVKNITAPFIAIFLVSSQTLAGSLYNCEMAGNGERICGSEENLSPISNVFSFWSNADNPQTQDKKETPYNKKKLKQSHSRRK